MVGEGVFKLCIGTFFTILLNAKKASHESNESVTEVNMMESLMKIGTPRHSSRGVGDKGSEVYSVKNCKREKSSWICYCKNDYIIKFKANYENEYKGLIGRTDKFVVDYLETEDMYSLSRSCQALIDLIKKDRTIAESTIFYIGNNGAGIAKQDLLSQSFYYAQFVILGIWHYIVSHPEIKNKSGKPTIDFLKMYKAQAPGKYPYPFGDEEDDPSKRNPVLNIDIKLLGKEVIENIKHDVNERIDIPAQLSDYLSAIRKEFSTIKPMFFNSPHPFYDLFVCSDLVFKNALTGQRTYFTNPTPSSIKELSNYIIFAGDGGLGKSMMMRHFLLESIDNYKEKRMVPFFIPLKDYTNDEKDLETFAYDNIHKPKSFTFDYMRQLLSEGNALLLLDGLDEIKSHFREGFQRNLNQFIDKYKNNMFIISSRGADCFESYERFYELQLSPLRLEQAVDLVQRIDYEKEAKDRFIEQLKKHIYKEHIYFASNPMLLTILLITFKTYADVPSKMHVFFSEAYQALATRHDASKNGLNRAFETKLPRDRFRAYLIRFCAALYLDEIRDFSIDTFYNIFDKIKTKAAIPGENVNATDFLDDLMKALCLVRKDGEKYHFINTSFEEYFAACQFTTVNDKDLELLASFLDKKKSFKGDKTLEMLYDMEPRKIEENLFIPYLSRIFEEAENDEDGQFWGFIKYLYPKMYYSYGDVLNDIDIESSRNVYNFIRGIAGIHSAPWVFDLIDEDLQMDFVKAKHYLITTKDGHNVPFPLEVVDPEDEKLMPQPVGYYVEIDTEYLMMEKSKYQSIIDEIADENQDFYQEYIKIKEYLESIKKKKESRSIDSSRLLD